MRTINLAEYKTAEVKFYSGRPRGEKVRDTLGFENEESQMDEYLIQIPQDTDSIHTSFFLGLFGPSVRKCGTRDAFLKKFKFQAPEGVMEDIEDGILQALKKSSVLQK